MCVCVCVCPGPGIIPYSFRIISSVLLGAQIHRQMLPPPFLITLLATGGKPGLFSLIMEGAVCLHHCAGARLSGLAHSA